jgi:hypothetical protein
VANFVTGFVAAATKFCGLGPIAHTLLKCAFLTPHGLLFVAWLELQMALIENDLVELLKQMIGGPLLGNVLMGTEWPRPPPAADTAPGLPLVLLEARLVCKGWCGGLLDAAWMLLTSIQEAHKEHGRSILLELCPQVSHILGPNHPSTKSMREMWVSSFPSFLPPRLKTSDPFNKLKPLVPELRPIPRELFGDDGAEIIDLFFLQSYQESNVMMDCDLIFTEEDIASDGSDYAPSDQEDDETLNSEDYE